MHFFYSFLTALIFGIIHQNIQKDSLKNEVYKFWYVAHSKQITWWLPKKKDEG